MILLDTSGLLAALDSAQRHHEESAAGLLEAKPPLLLADLGISLADASIAVLAAAHETRDVLTLDERHFRVLTVDGEPFRVLPVDGRSR